MADSTPTIPAGLFREPRTDAERRPATDAEMAAVQAALGITLPAVYTAVLRARNGGLLRLRTFNLKRKPPARSHASKKYHVPELAGVAADSNGLVHQTELGRSEWGLPPMLIPLCGDGHWWCCLDYRACGPHGEPTVTHFEEEAEIELEVAPNFAAFLKGLYRAKDDREPAVIALDRGAPRGEGIGPALEALGCKRHMVDGWSNPQYPMPPAWTWEKYRSNVDGLPVWIEAWKNRLYPISRPLTPERPDHHPMLVVRVCDEDAEACLAEVLAAAGPGAVLIRGVL